MKGGVGKTTIAVNIASALAKLRNKKVLLIDLDPQYNATQYLVNTEKYPEYVNGKEPTVYDIIMEGKKITPPSVVDGSQIMQKRISIEEVARTLYQHEDGKLDLIPGTLHLINLEMMMQRGIENKLSQFIQTIERKYDFIFIDCPPTFSIYLLSGFLASKYYLVPLKPDPLSTLGVPLLEQVIDVYSETYSKEIKPLGIIFTMVRNTNEMRDVMESIKDTSAGKHYVFKNILSYSTTIAEASRENLPLFEYSRSSFYGKQIIDITDELLSIIP